MKRTAEKTLSIISLVFTVISIISSFFLVGFARLVSGGEFGREMEKELLADPNITPEDIEMTLWLFEFLEGFIWFFVAILLISLIATIIGIVFIWNNKNPKIAGIMFIIAGLFAGIISPTSIMLYIAAILSFTSKPPVDDYSFAGENHDDSMRPL